MKLQELAPVLFVPEIEPCLPFWTERLGFSVGPTVEHAGRLGFVALRRDAVRVMYQTHASVRDDMPQLAPADLQTCAFLYLRVDDLDAVERALADEPRLLERRKTFYGATELAVREPAGNPVVFAQFGD